MTPPCGPPDVQLAATTEAAERRRESAMTTGRSIGANNTSGSPSASPRLRVKNSGKQIRLPPRRSARVAEVVVGEFAGHTAAGSALEEADLDEVRLVQILDRPAILGDR